MIKASKSLSSSLVLGILAVSLSVVGLVKPAFAESSPLSDPMTFLRQSLEAQRHLTYIAEVETTDFDDRATEVNIAQVSHRASGETSRFFLAPKVIYQNISLIRNGKSYEFDMHRRLVIESSHREPTKAQREQRFALIEKNYRSMFGPSQMIADRATRNVMLFNRHSGHKVVSVWIDEATYLPLRRERFEADGSISELMQFTSLRYVPSVADSAFETRIPPGFRVIVKESPDFPERSLAVPQAPQYLPEGFTLIGAKYTRLEGTRSLHLFYSDGLRRLSLFESSRGARAGNNEHVTHVMIGSNVGSLVEDGDSSVVSWSADNVHLTLVSDLGTQELLEIARGIAPSHQTLFTR